MAENNAILKSIEEQIRSLKELTSTQIGNLNYGVKKDVDSLNHAIREMAEKVQDLSNKLEDKYVSKEFLAQTVILINEQNKAEINKVYEKFNPIRSILIFIATTTGAVMLVAIANFLFGGIGSQIPP